MVEQPVGVRDRLQAGDAVTGCKPTVGEVRETDAFGYRVEVAVTAPWSTVWIDERGRWREGGRVVEVAPANRSRVTAGPSWMRGAR